jgi:hypothetical protein
MDTQEKKPLAHEDARKRYERRAPTTGTVKVFESDEHRAQHLREVEEAQKNGAPF